MHPGNVVNTEPFSLWELFQGWVCSKLDYPHHQLSLMHQRLNFAPCYFVFCNASLWWQSVPASQCTEAYSAWWRYVFHTFAVSHWKFYLSIANSFSAAIGWVAAEHEAFAIQLFGDFRPGLFSSPGCQFFSWLRHDKTFLAFLSEFLRENQSLLPQWLFASLHSSFFHCHRPCSCFLPSSPNPIPDLSKAGGAFGNSLCTETSVPIGSSYRVSFQ